MTEKQTEEEEKLDKKQTEEEEKSDKHCSLGFPILGPTEQRRMEAGRSKVGSSSSSFPRAVVQLRRHSFIGTVTKLSTCGG